MPRVVGHCRLCVELSSTWPHQAEIDVLGWLRQFETMKHPPCVVKYRTRAAALARNLLECVGEAHQSSAFLSALLNGRDLALDVSYRMCRTRCCSLSPHRCCCPLFLFLDGCPARWSGAASSGATRHDFCPSGRGGPSVTTTNTSQARPICPPSFPPPPPPTHCFDCRTAHQLPPPIQSDNQQ